MKIILLLVALLWSHSSFADPKITICKGQFALCAASACEPTGGTITNQSGESFPEVK